MGQGIVMSDLQESRADLEIHTEGMAYDEAHSFSQGYTSALRDILLRLGVRRFGEPTEDMRQIINSVADVSRLNALINRLLVRDSWYELLLSVPGILLP